MKRFIALCLLCFILPGCGSPPLPLESKEERMNQVCQHDIIPPGELNGPLGNVIVKSMVKSCEAGFMNGVLYEMERRRMW